MVELVIARYNEDVSWAAGLNCTVYSKGDPTGLPTEVVLPNVGREAHTYLTHIVKRWNDLADYTVFVQGDPTDHLGGNSIEAMMAERSLALPRVVRCCEWDTDGRLRHWGVWQERFAAGKLRKSELSMAEWFAKYLLIDINGLGSLAYTPGACFGVKRNVIQRRPKSFYQSVLGSIPDHHDPEEAYYLERAWMYFFLVGPP